MITRIGYVAVDVRDLEASVRFYTETLGLRVVDEAGDCVFLSSGRLHHELVVRPARAGRAGFRHLGLEVAAGTLDAVTARALGAGATALDETDAPGVERVAALGSPAGFRIELFEGMGTEEAPARATGPVRFEHVNLASPDIDRWDAFLAEGLGLRWSDRAYDAQGTVISWFHCPVAGADHHGVATTRAPVPRLHHVKWEYPDVEEVVRRVDEHCSAGGSLIWGMGRHGVDRSIFAYVKDPDGLMHELGLGMLDVDASEHWHGPRELPIDTPRFADLWGSAIPRPWLEAGIPLAPGTARNGQAA